MNTTSRNRKFGAGLIALAATALAAAPLRADEDPFLGQIKAIKCVGCDPGWVDIVVHDPIDVRDFELRVKDTDYYKILSPLPGKQIHDKDGACFYWFETPKGAAPAKQKPAAKDGKPGNIAVTPPATKDSAAQKDSTTAKDAKPPVDSAGHDGTNDSAVAAAPAAAKAPAADPPQEDAAPKIQSRCVPYVHAAAPKPAK